jgi:phenylacetic acid degradation operon negative regulatory protein
MSAARQTAPRLSQRHAAGAAGVRGLLFTVLGEFVRPSGGSAWTSSILELLARLGIEEKAARQALLRTAVDGWLVGRRAGRRTCWQLSPSAERLLGEGADRIYGFRGVQADWDGRWLVVVARPPDSDRRARHRLSSRLRWAGLGSPAPGVWVSTHVDRAAEVESALAEAGVSSDAQLLVGEYRGGASQDALARSAWDLDAVARSYREFLATFADRTGSDPLVAVTELVHAWRRFPELDPALPVELLPPDWSGAAAAELFARQHRRWTAAAVAAWARLERGGDRPDRVPG